MEFRKTKGGEYDFWRPRWYVFNTYWRLTLLSVQRRRSRGTWGPKLLLRDTLRHTSSFVKRFEYLAGMYHYECTKSNGIIVVMTIKNTCYFRLDRDWNIHVETTENSISRFLDFNIFWGKKPLEARAFGTRSISCWFLSVQTPLLKPPVTPLFPNTLIV